MKKILKAIFLPFRFLFDALIQGVGIALFLAVSAGMIIGMLGFFAGIFETIKSGNPALLILAFISAIFSGVCFKIFNRIMFNT